MNSNLFTNEEIFVIAEIGKNFIQVEDNLTVEEYITNAKNLVDAAKESGANAVKFQTHELEDEQLDVEIISPHFQSSDRYSWVKRNTSATPDKFWKEISDYCKFKEITFFSTPMSRMAARKVQKYVSFWKVGSGDLQDYLLLNELIKTKKPIIISTGMVSLSELDSVVNYLLDRDVDLSILYCVSKYPCPEEDFNLSTIEYFMDKYANVPIGFSDHSLGISASLAAVKAGACIIEKHFTLSRNFWGSDHKVSLIPEEMKLLVDSLKSRNFQDNDYSMYLGSKKKELEGAKNKFRPFFEKRIVAGIDIFKGETITEEMVFSMRPAKKIEGFHSNDLLKVIGKKAKVTLKKYEPINSKSIE